MKALLIVNNHYLFVFETRCQVGHFKVHRFGIGALGGEFIEHF